MRPLDMKDFELVVTLTRTHKAMKRMYGEDWEKTVKPYIDTIRANMAETGRLPLPCLIDIIGEQKVKEVAATMAMYIAAAMEIINADEVPTCD